MMLAAWFGLVAGLADCSRMIFQYFFFSSRRRHTSFSRDWSSDVCSSDLIGRDGLSRRDRYAQPALHTVFAWLVCNHIRQRSEERRVGKSVDLGGRRSMIKKTLMTYKSRMQKS